MSEQEKPMSQGEDPVYDGIDDTHESIAALEAQVAELQREKYGTPCKCESWIETARVAEERAEALEAVNVGLRDALEAVRDRSIMLDPFTLHTIETALATAREPVIHPKGLE